MYKMNFVSNPRIVFFADGTEHEDGTRITVEQIPSIIIPALSNAIGTEIIISLNIFADKDYKNYVKALIVTWDGTCVTKRCAMLYGDGAYAWRERDGHSVWDIM